MILVFALLQDHFHILTLCKFVDKVSAFASFLGFHMIC